MVITGLIIIMLIIGPGHLLRIFKFLILKVNRNRRLLHLLQLLATKFARFVLEVFNRAKYTSYLAALVLVLSVIILLPLDLYLLLLLHFLHRMVIVSIGNKKLFVCPLI